MTDKAVGTALFAPQARLVDLATGRVIGVTSSGTDQDRTFSVAPDLLSATATLPATGIGHLEVTLNNQRHVAGMPVFPPWKYNNFALPTTGAQNEHTNGLAAVAFGQRVRLDLRYGDGNWVKMIIAQVTDLKFTFPQSGFAQVTVVGEDLLSLLNIKPTADKPYANKQEETILDEIVTAVYTDAQQRPSTFTDPRAQTSENRTNPLRSVTHTKSQSYFQFLTSFTERMDYELCLVFKQLEAQTTRNAALAANAPVTASSELELRFVPARSKTAPPAAAQSAWDTSSAGDNFHYVLAWGATLIDFTPSFKVFDMPTTAEAVGTQPGRRARQTQSLSQGDIDAFFTAELPEAPGYEGLARTTAVVARQQFFGQVGVTNDNAESSAGSNLDDPRLKLQALARFAKRVREFMTAEATVIGLPKLRAGTYVEIVGLRPPFDGYYYVAKTVHTLDGSAGYRTKLTLRRPGMLPPSAYLDRPRGAK